MQMRDPYKALGVDAKTSDAEIKKAYRRLAKQFHPDRTGGDKAKESRFKDISTAYEILSDPAKRAQYDNAASGGSMPTGDLSDIFAQMFGGQQRQQRQGGNPFGGANPFGGMGGGSPFGGGMGGGMGGMGGGARQQQRPKPAPKPAPKDRKVKAKDGSELTLRGTRISSDLRITYDQAMLGVVANVPTLSGAAKVRIPPGTSSGQKLRLKGKGHRASNGSYGDHFVTVQIDVPKVEDEQGSELLANLVEFLGSKDSKKPS